MELDKWREKSESDITYLSNTYFIYNLKSVKTLFKHTRWRVWERLIACFDIIIWCRNYKDYLKFNEYPEDALK